MKISQKYISLELAKQIANVAREKRVQLPESEESYFVNMSDDNLKPCETSHWQLESVKELTIEDKKFSVPAYDCTELWDILPGSPGMKKIGDTYSIDLFYTGGVTRGHSAVDVMGEALLYVLKNDLLRELKKK